jgi:hypothetical protein
MKKENINLTKKLPSKTKKEHTTKKNDNPKSLQSNIQNVWNKIQLYIPKKIGNL